MEKPLVISGTSVSLSADGSTVAIGAYSGDANGEDPAMCASIDNAATKAWEQVGTDIDGEAAGDLRN